MDSDSTSRKCKTFTPGIILAIVILLSGPGFAGAQSDPDTSVVFSLAQYLQLVIENHPVSKQAGLLRGQAEAGLQIARGGFDPKWYAEWQHKSFGGKNYYNLGESGIKLPTRIGWEIKGSYQVANGAFVNPENKLPQHGQAIIGLKIPLLQGMLTDQRRTHLAQAKLMTQLNEAQRRNSMNDLLQYAIQAYWDWSLAFNKCEIARQAGEIARTRADALRQSFLAGDKPAIDTLETHIQWQNRIFELNEARVCLQNSELALSTFLWGNDDSPMQLGSTVAPQDLQSLVASEISVPDRDSIFRLLEANHPELQAYRLKQNHLEFERRLQMEMLKPRLDLEYNLLGNGFEPFDNYKVGLSAEFPLFLRKERGKLELTDLKLLDNDLSLLQKQLTLNNKLQAYFNEFNTLLDQITWYESVISNYQALLDAESVKFQMGESSVFLLNSRENKLIEARSKLAELKAKLLKAYYQIQWAAGLLPGI